MTVNIDIIIIKLLSGSKTFFPFWTIIITKNEHQYFLSSLAYI